MTAAPPSSSYQFGPFRLDVREQRLLRDGRTIRLTPKVFAILHVLVDNGGHLVEKDDLLKQVWPDSFVEEGALNRAVSVLRKALDDNPAGQKYIETIPKRGYRFVAPVTRWDGTPQTPPGDRSSAVGAKHVSRPLATAAAALMVVAASLWFGLSRRNEGVPNTTSPRAPVHRQVTFSGREGAPTVSPDGRRIAYVSNGKSEKTLAVEELAGGGRTEIFSAPEINYLRWSPDGAELLAWARGAGRNGIYVVPQLGGTSRQIATGMTFVACWSPDGLTIATAGALDNKIRFFDSYGHELRSVTLLGDHWSIWDLDWSADSDRLLFASSDREGRYQIGTIRPDGTDQQKVLSSPTEIPSTRWAPHGNAIYYFQRINQTVSLFRIPASGTDTTTGTAVLTGLETDRFFALSGDARRLVYARAPYYSNLRMHDVMTGHTTELTQGTSLIERPRVSPDGAHVVFNVGHDPRTNLYTLPITGGTPKQITFLDALCVGGAWSGNGERIAFASLQGDHPSVGIIPAAGGSVLSLPSDELSDNLDVVWGPGARILYQRAGNQNYYEVDLASGSKRLLVRDGAPGWLFAPVYSPDGKKIAVMWNRPPARGIWIIDAGDSSERLLYGSKAASIRPIGWSKDGGSIYVVEGKNGPFRGATSFVGETTTDAAIRRIALTDGTIQTVLSLPGDEIGSVTMTPDSQRFIYPVFASRSDVWVVDDFDAPLGAGGSPPRGTLGRN
jgi:Tol biopolymer transport system component/DNA-binding winged helix-turn-helix (wHTH) protein